MKLLRNTLLAAFIADGLLHVWFVFFAAPEWGYLSEKTLRVQMWLFPSIYVIYALLMMLVLLQTKRR